MNKTFLSHSNNIVQLRNFFEKKITENITGTLHYCLFLFSLYTSVIFQILVVGILLLCSKICTKYCCSLDISYIYIQCAVVVARAKWEEMVMVSSDRVMVRTKYKNKKVLFRNSIVFYRINCMHFFILERTLLLYTL
jgi:uncharacterized membrane protein